VVVNAHLAAVRGAERSGEGVKTMEQSSATFTVWTIEAPPEPTVKVNRIIDLTAHICDLAMGYCGLDSKITITASEMTQEEWNRLPEFEGAPSAINTRLTGAEARIENADSCAGCELEEFCAGHPFTDSCARHRARLVTLTSTDGLGRSD